MTFHFRDLLVQGFNKAGTKAGLARKLGIRYEILLQLERGHREPTEEQIEALVSYLKE